MSQHLYVYFKVPDNAAHDLLPRWRAWLDDIHAACGVRGALMRRPATGADGLQTWMEVFYDIPDGFSETLGQLWSAQDLHASIQGTRHLELFEDLIADNGSATCA